MRKRITFVGLLYTMSSFHGGSKNMDKQYIYEAISMSVRCMIANAFMISITLFIMIILGIIHVTSKKDKVKTSTRVGLIISGGIVGVFLLPILFCFFGTYLPNIGPYRRNNRTSGWGLVKSYGAK